MQIFYSVFHLLAALVLLGGFAFWATSAVTDAPREVLRRSYWLAGGSLVILIPTGLLMLEKWHLVPGDLLSDRLLSDRFGVLMAIKLVAVIAMIVGLWLSRSSSLRLWRLLLLVGVVVVLVSILLVR